MTIAGTSASSNLMISKSGTAVSNNSTGNHVTGSSSSTIILPAGQLIPSGAAELSNFINTIRPPSIPGTSAPQQQQQQKQPQIILQKGSTVSNVTPTTSGVKKQNASGGIHLLNASSLAAATSNLTSGSFKVIMTSNGQQIILNPSDLINLQAAVKNSASGSGSSTTVIKTESQSSGSQQQKAILTTGSGGQQIVFLTPTKSTPLTAVGQTVKIANANSVTGQQISAGSASLKNLAPAPSGSNVRLIQATNSSVVNQMAKDGKMQVIRIVTSSAAGGKAASATTTGPLRSIAPSPKTYLIPTSGKSGIANLVTGAGGQLLTTTSGSGNQQVFMLPANMIPAGSILKSATGQNIMPKVTIQSSSQQSAKSYVPIAPSPLGGHVLASGKEVLSGLTKHHHQQQHHQNGPSSKTVTIGGTSSFPGITAEDLSRQRKPCNCTKSQCLKLYCDCFANGEFCKDCNCNNCNNNLEHEEERQKAVRQCLERNPHAFQPKIGKGRIMGDVPERRHTKGCNCRRSGCLKNYCEVIETSLFGHSNFRLSSDLFFSVASSFMLMHEMQCNMSPKGSSSALFIIAA